MRGYEFVARILFESMWSRLLLAMRGYEQYFTVNGEAVQDGYFSPCGVMRSERSRRAPLLLPCGVMSRIHGIEPFTLLLPMRGYEFEAIAKESGGLVSPEEHIQAIEKEMKEAASRLEFERAAALRDEIKRLREKQLKLLQ